MADYTAIYEAGNALVELLRESLTPEPISKPELISLCSPHESENNQLTVYLYHIEENAMAAKGYQSMGRNAERMSPTELNAEFLLTAHSNAPMQMKEADKYRIMGAVMQTLKDSPSIDPRFMSGSLAQSDAHLILTVERPNLDQLLKIWNNNASPYKLSLVAKISGIQIDSKRKRRISRVTDVEIGVEQKPRAGHAGR